MNPWTYIESLESLLAEFFGSKYAVVTDSCTHALELCYIQQQLKTATCPTRTYISTPFTFIKLGMVWKFEEKGWQDYYQIGNSNIYDAAVLWRANSYLPGTMMCLSFQHRKHLSLGRGGAILLDDLAAYQELRKLRYDGRDLDHPWAEQNITSLGYHYYMTPETAELGIKRFQEVKNLQPKIWTQDDYPYLPNMGVFDVSKK